tara:strand:- start:675 stop:968 length:294 start_codon:yes stop_codon:yes gene_type:complete
MFKDKDYGEQLDRDTAAYILKFTTTIERSAIAETQYSTVERVLNGSRKLTENNSAIIELVAFKASVNDEENEKIINRLKSVRKHIAICMIGKLAVGK